MSRRPGPTQGSLTSSAIPATTPGIAGRLDAGDPSVHAERGDTPGSVGHGDHAVPRRKHHADARKHPQHSRRHAAAGPLRQSVLQAKIHRHADQEQGHSFSVVLDARRIMVSVEDHEEVIAIVYFATDDHALGDDDKAALQKVYNAYAALLFKPQLRRYEVAFKIEGFADYRGTEKHNKKLSQQRADAVAAYFEPLTASDRFTKDAQGMPLQHPQAVRPGGVPVSRQLNPFRRVDLKARPVLTYWREKPDDDDKKKKDDKKPAITCALASVDLHCEHGRKSGDERLLIVVPSSTAAVGDSIGGVVQINAGCGKHPTWSIGGFWTSRGKGTTFNFNADTWSAALQGLESLEYVSPHTYQISVDACSGSRSFEVRAYPPGSVSFKIDLKRLHEIIENIKKHLPIPEEDLKGWDGPTGSILYEGRWQEDEKSWKGFYSKSWSGQFDPLFGGHYKGPLAPTLAVPTWLKDWVKAGLYLEGKGGGKLQLSFKGKRWAHNQKSTWHEVAVTGGVSFTGRLSVDLKLVDARFIDGSIAGEITVSGTVTGSVGEGPTVNGITRFEGLLGVATIRAAWGIVEYARTFQLMKEREFPWKFHLGQESGEASHE